MKTQIIIVVVALLLLLGLSAGLIAVSWLTSQPTYHPIEIAYVVVEVYTIITDQHLKVPADCVYIDLTGVTIRERIAMCQLWGMVRP